MSSKRMAIRFPLFFSLLIGCSGLLYPVELISQALPGEIPLLKKFNSREIKPITMGMKLTSRTVTPFAITVSAGLIAAGLLQDRQRVTVDGIQTGTALILSSLASTGLKYSVGRKRPGIPGDGIINRVQVRDPSFPSGHTTVAFALVTAVSILKPDWYVIAPCSIWAGTVAVSRMYLGVHFPTDILGGMVLGTGFSFLVWQTRKWMEKR